MNRLLLLSIAVAGLIVPVRTRAGDVLVTQHGVLTGEVLRVENDTVVMRINTGEMRVPRTDVVQVKIEAPASYQSGRAALATGKFADAVAALQPVVDRYAGLPVPWLQDAMLALGQAYIGAKDTQQAEAVLERFAHLYPEVVKSSGLVVQRARLAAGQGRLAEALAAVQTFLEPLLKKEPLSDDEPSRVAEALIVQGDCRRATHDLPRALDSYLMVTTLFDDNDALAAEAALKAGQTFEAMNNVKRARDTYTSLDREYPQSVFAKTARDRLAALGQTRTP